MCGIVLCIKADQRASEADNAVGDADKTHKRAEDLKSKLEQKIKGNRSITFVSKLNSVPFLVAVLLCFKLFFVPLLCPLFRL